MKETEPKRHEPVLLEEVLEHLNLKPDCRVVDATLGYLGHGREIQERLGEEGIYVGIDWDSDPVEHARRLPPVSPAHVEYVQGNFARMPEILRSLGIEKVDRVLFDLGVNSPSLDKAERGLGIKHPDAPLDFRLSDEAIGTAAEFLNSANVTEIADVLYQYGDERRSRAIARAVVEQRQKRPFRIMSDFTDLVHRVYRTPRAGKIDSATKSAMAIRIYLNRELENLQAGLEGALEVLGAEGRILVISFHGLEDGIVKRFFRKRTGKCECPPELPICQCGARKVGRILTKKPIWATEEEKRRNPRSRSARLRVFEKQ